MSQEYMLAEKLIKNGALEREEYTSLFRVLQIPWDAEEVQKKQAGEVKALLQKEALRLQKKYYGNQVFVRGLIEISNYCKNDCHYCGIQRSNRQITRYRLSEEEILSCCRQGYALGFRTFVLQGGEDPYYTDERIVSIVKRIKEAYPDCAVTLSIGEKSKESYRLYKEAGADRYLLRHETADRAHYALLHPKEMSFDNRRRCLYDLKDLGYQVGAGFMVGSPGQTLSALAEDMIFLKELKPDMVGIGPFLPHHDTPYRDEAAGDVDFTIALLSVLRIILPHALLPATTALGTADAMGREKGILAGANVVMPNLSPEESRKLYELYDNKLHSGGESAQGRKELEARMEAIGYRVVTDRGDVRYLDD